MVQYVTRDEMISRTALARTPPSPEELAWVKANAVEAVYWAEERGFVYEIPVDRSGRSIYDALEAEPTAEAIRVRVVDRETGEVPFGTPDSVIAHRFPDGSMIYPMPFGLVAGAWGTAEADGITHCEEYELVRI